MNCEDDKSMTAPAQFLASAIAACSVMPMIVCVSTQSHAAGSAYQVDTGEVNDPGFCKVDTWASFSNKRDTATDKRDFFSSVSPNCSLPVGFPFELSAQFTRSRTDGEWDTGVIPKFALGLLAGDLGKPNVAFTGALTYDFTSSQATAINFAVPVSVRLVDALRINANAGWLYDRTMDRHYLSYGLGVDLRTPGNVWQLTAEVFGQALNSADPPSAAQPRYQIGLRWRPVFEWSIDGIYGRNITGNNGSWFTVAMVRRWPPKPQ